MLKGMAKSNSPVKSSASSLGETIIITDKNNAALI